MIVRVSDVLAIKLTRIVVRGLNSSTQVWEQSCQLDIIVSRRKIDALRVKGNFGLNSIVVCDRDIAQYGARSI